jgi:hypothetical protein
MLPSALRRRGALTLGVGLLLATSGVGLDASGTYRTRSRPPAIGSVDSERYLLGKEIFSGKREPSAADPSAQEAQQRRLAALAGQLPAKAGSNVALTALAGRLTARELDALEYYLAVRFKVHPGRL